ncbi:NADAR family protein [Bacterioplanoides sp.]|uniref:NADAR family protein n=1 Tax=Bacterioplanoides sp. TaxID=2066072 RepID=UPI003AFF92AE
MGLFPEENLNSHFFSRHDANELLGSASPHGFYLDDQDWPSVEHYFQAMQFDNPGFQEKIRHTKTAEDAIKFTKWRFWQRRKDWKQRRQVLMTRAMYTKCKAHLEVAAALLDSGDQTLVENSMYDYFWGCGRDRRGQNQFGKILMNVREKLQQETSES